MTEAPLRSPSLRDLSQELDYAPGVRHLKWFEAKRMLEKIGFVCIRSRTHTIMQRGHIKLVLPHSGQCNSASTKIVHRLVAGYQPEPKEMRALAQAEPEIALDPDIPLNVLWQNQRHSIIADEGEHWRLRSHLDGKVAVVLKTVTEIEETPMTPEFSVIPAEEASQVVPEPVVTAPTYTPMTNSSDLAALVRLTQRRMESLKVERDQLYNKLQTLEESYQASVAYLKSLGVNVLESSLNTQHPKASANGHGGARANTGRRIGLTESDQDKIRMAMTDIGWDSGVAAVSRRLTDHYGLEIKYGSLDYYVKKFRLDADKT